MHIPFHRPYITDDEIDAVVGTLKKHWLTMGDKTMEFEKRFSDYLGVKSSIAVNSCTAALHLALKVMGLREGDEVIVPSITFVSTAGVVRYFNALPVLVDVERDTHLIDVHKVEDKITERTKAIIPVHYAGQPCDMDAIMAIAEKHSLYVIEDAAHSLPAWYRDKKIGTIGDITCFSFYATKPLNTGEGGMVTLDNAEWDEQIRMLRLHGISKDAWKRYSDEGSWEYDVLYAGFKYNTTDINAAMGIEQLNKLEWMWNERKGIAERYNQAFFHEEGVVPYQIKEDRISSWHLYPLRLNIESLKINRDQFVIGLKKRGIGTSVHFIPLYRFTYYRDMGYSDLDFPESEWVFKRIISLPIFPAMSTEEIDYVIENVLELIKKNRR